MTSYPKITVITPSYNQGQFLEQTILSVLNQGYPNLEYIVIDGGSTDGSVDILRHYERYLSFWVSEKDKGQSHAFNKGLLKSTGEIIGWLNSDDIYLDRCLFQAAEYFRHHPETDIVFSDYWFIDEQGRFLKKRKEIPFQFGVYIWTSNCYHANCAGFFRKRVFNTIGGLKEELHYGMDYEFYLRAARAGFVFDHQRGCWGAYRLHKSSKSVSHYVDQLHECKTIFEQYIPPKISGFGRWWRQIGFSLFRIIWKFLIGGYFQRLRKQGSKLGVQR